MDLVKTKTFIGLILIFTLVSVSPILAEETIPDEETLLVEESPIDTETLLSYEDQHLNSDFLAEEETPAEETTLAEEIPLDEETPTEIVTLPIQEPQRSAESMAASLNVSADDFYDDDFDFDSLFYEADPIVKESDAFEGIRSFDDIFPFLSRSQRSRVNSELGLRYAFEKADTPTITPSSNSGIDLLSSVMAKKPSHIVEALVLVPYDKRELDMLDIYNALIMVSKIKDYTVPLSGRQVKIFVDTTRLESARNRVPISDPKPATFLPFEDQMHLRFTDAYYGDIFIRADVSMSNHGITYNMTNFRDVRYALVPIMRAERVSVIIYLEPVKEGVLIYSLSGFYLPGIIANSANLTPPINRRITVLQNWITDGLRRQDSVIN